MMGLSGHNCFIVAVLSFSLGCNPLDSSIVLKPEEYSKNEEKNIVVYTKDGKELDFSGGRHRILQRGDSLLLSGSGTLHRLNGEYVGKKFEGEIPRDQIDRIEVPTIWDPARFGGVLLALCIIIPLGYYGLR